jgi:hypothetical protein
MLIMEDKEISEDRAEELLSKVLQKAWAGDEARQDIVHRVGRWNISCPYCGDSKDPGKKRGNFYPKTLTYKCYNSGCKYSGHKVFRDLMGMLEDFDVQDSVDPIEKAGIINAVREGRKNITVTYKGSNEDLLTAELKDKLVLRSELMKKMKLDEVIGTPMETYLVKRQQIPDKRFASDPFRNRLFIFNMDPKQEYIIGLQIRNFKISKGNKYMTYRLSKIWTDFMGCQDTEFLQTLEKLDTVSNLFGIFTANLTKTFTLFEGPMDSFLFPNSLALCSLNNQFPFDLKNKRWFLDDDVAGRTKSLQLLEEGDSVFLWKKFKRENDIKASIKDLNDLVVYLRVNNKKIQRLDRYFSESKWDLIDL